MWRCIEIETNSTFKFAATNKPKKEMMSEEKLSEKEMKSAAVGKSNEQPKTNNAHLKSD